MNIAPHTIDTLVTIIGNLKPGDECPRALYTTVPIFTDGHSWHLSLDFKAVLCIEGLEGAFAGRDVTKQLMLEMLLVVANHQGWAKSGEWELNP